MAEDVQPEAPETTDQPEPEEVSAPEGTSADEAPEVEESFTDLDPAEAPEGEVTQEWLNERYKQMQADYTRKRQADSATAKERAEELEFLEALRSDRDTQQEVLDYLREQLEAESDEEFDGEEEDPIASKVRELSEREERREAEALARNVVSHIEQLAKDAKLELDEDDLKDIFGSATSRDAVNNKNTQAAFEAWQKRESDKQAKWLKSYLASKQAPRQVPAGQSATESPNLSDHDERVKRMAAIMEGNS
jgi:hypothetical protein